MLALVSLLAVLVFLGFVLFLMRRFVGLLIIVVLIIILLPVGFALLSLSGDFVNTLPGPIAGVFRSFGFFLGELF